jgi:selenocysteine-specific elongation factor
LVKALTGTDPDRLAEEKRRGITIELGFAQLTLPSGATMGIVDVPGHERFVRQMMAGASGVDVALLVVAADDGVMPQTREHLTVLEMLDVQRLVVALTKMDKVDAEWAELVQAELEDFLQHSAYAGAPVVPVSAVTGQGLDALLAAIERTADATVAHDEAAAARLAVDRAFTIKGAGTVITGTLWTGQIAEGQMLEIIPGVRQVRARSVQSHGVPVALAHAGSRVALNLAGVKPSEVAPGCFVAAPGLLTPSDRLDVRVRHLGARLLKSGARVRIAHGTREVLARLLLMTGEAADGPGEQLQPGEIALAQLRLDEPLAPLPFDRFVMRSYSPVTVIGGGLVLAVHPRRRTTLKDAERQLLEALEQHEYKIAIEKAIELAAVPVSLASLSAQTGLEPALIAAILPQVKLQELPSAPLDCPKHYAPEPLQRSLLANLETCLLNFHSANPQLTGLSLAALAAAFKPGATGATVGRLDEQAFKALVNAALAAGFAVYHAGEISHGRFGAGARQLVQQAAEALGQLLAQAGPTPPAVEQLPALLGLDKTLTHKALGQLEAAGSVERLPGGFVFDAAAYASLRDSALDYLGSHGPATAAALREAMGVSRKYAIPLLEHFDAQNLTKRQGDLRTRGSRSR